MKKKIYINENQISKVVTLLTENWANTKRAIVRKTLRVLNEIIPNCSEEELSSMEKNVLKYFFHGRDASNPKLRPLEPLVAKILYGELNYQSNFMRDKYGIFKLKKVLRNIKTLVANNIKLEASINDTLDTLAERFGTKGEDLEKFGVSRESIIQNYEKGEYSCVEIENFEQAAEYGKYTNPNGVLCYTEDEDTWNGENYANEGMNTCYVFLKNGWKQEPPEDGEDSPYDDYGLSMIWIFVSPEGEIVTSNSRWNHHNEENLPPGRETDYSFDESEILEITGYDINELESENDIALDFLEKTNELKKRINSGMNIREACNGIVDKIETFGDGILILSIGEQSTFVKDGKFLYPNLWVTEYPSGNVLKLYCGKAINIMFNDGSLLVNNNVWCENIRYIPNEKVFIITSGKKNNILDLNRNPLLKKPADEIKKSYGSEKLNCTFLNVSYNGKWYLYSFDKKDFITYEPSNKKLEYMDNSHWFSFYEVNPSTHSSVINLINTDGNKLYEHGMFTYVSGRFVSGMMEVKINDINNSTNLISVKGELMFDKNAKFYCEKSFGNYGLLCKVNGKYYVINENHSLSLLTDVINSLMANNPEVISSMADTIYFETSSSKFSSNKVKLICVKNNYEVIKNVLNGNTVICDDWFNELYSTNGIGVIGYKVCSLRSYNIIKPDGTLLFDTNATRIDNWNNDYLIAKFEESNGWRTTNAKYALVNVRTLEIKHTDIKELDSVSDESNPIPVHFIKYSNYIKPNGELLNDIKYRNVFNFNKYGWAETVVEDENYKVGHNVVFKDGSVLSNESYEKILGGTDEIIVVEKKDKEIYVIEVPTKKESKYTYNMFQYLYKKGLGNIFAYTYEDDELDDLNIAEIGIKKNPLDNGIWRKPVCIAYNYIDLDTKEFILPRFYTFVKTNDRKVFIVYTDKQYDVIDKDGNSLVGGRNIQYVDNEDAKIGSYRIDFIDNSGQEYTEYYDDDFKLIKRT